MMVSRYGKKELIYFEKPEVVLGHRSFMGGVDKLHQFCACLSFTTKSCKWGERTIFLAFEVAVVNSFILSNTDKKRKWGETTDLANCKNLITMLTDNVTKTGRPSSSSDKKTG